LPLYTYFLGENDRAFQWLEKAREGKNLELMMLKLDPRFDPIRNDPRFADLCRGVPLPG
jgi:hypothetical protein